MVVKNLDCTITGSKSPRTLTVDTSGSDTARAKLTKFRDYRPSSLAFCAELHDGRVRVEGSPIGQNMADQLNQLRKGYRLDPDPDSARKKQGLRIVDDKLSVFHIQSTAAAALCLKAAEPWWRTRPLLPARGGLILDKSAVYKPPLRAASFV